LVAHVALGLGGMIPPVLNNHFLFPQCQDNSLDIESHGRSPAKMNLTGKEPKNQQ
jgi:hypothetical protein